jgi:hypothetical protein
MAPIIGSGLTTEVQGANNRTMQNTRCGIQNPGKGSAISARRSAVLLGISRSWTALANQLEHLTAIVKEEGK